MSNWDGLKTLGEWSERLRECLDKGSSAIVAKDVQAMTLAQNQLIEFREHSPNYDIAGIDQLDDIAYKMIKDLTKAALGQALDGMESRTDELLQYMKEIKAISEDARKAADLISLERFKKVTKSLSALISKVKALKVSLANADPTKVQAILDDLEGIKAELSV